MNFATASKPRALGHLGLHYRPGEAQLALRFFELLGGRIKAFGPFPNGDYFYIIALNTAAPDDAEDIVFLSAMSPQQHALEQELAAYLGVNKAEQHPALCAYFDFKQQEPEYFLHFGIHFAALDDLEQAVQRLMDEARTVPEFGQRIQGMLRLKARSGTDAAIDARMAASPLFADAEREAFGPNLVQLHIRTDLIATGLSFLGAVVELDYVFTGEGRGTNPFNDLCM